MTPQEMQIEVLQGLDNVNADFYDEFEPPEIDLALNKMMGRMVQETFPARPGSKKFEGVQRPLEDIKPLIRTVDITALASYEGVDDRTYIMLPADYLYLISDTTKLDYNCTTLVKSVDAANFEYRAKVEILVSQAAQPYSSLILKYDGATIFDMQDWAPNGWPDADDYFDIIHLLREELDKLYRLGTIPFQTYWERYRDEYTPNTFYFVSTDPTSEGKIIFREEDGNAISVPLVAATADLITTTTTELTDRTSPNRMTENELIDTKAILPYRKTHRESPLSIMQNRHQLIVYSDETFILKGIKITYIRKPTRISLFLNRSCELPERNVHQDIVNMTITHLLERLESKRLESTLIEKERNI